MKKIKRPKGKLLLADSSAGRRRSLSGALSAAGYEMLETDNAIMAYQLVLQQSPDLVIISTEIRLEPATSFCGKLKRTERLRQLPVIVCEATVLPVKPRNALRRAVDAYIRFPAESAQVLPVVQNLMQSVLLTKRNTQLKENLTAHEMRLRAVSETEKKFVPAESLRLLGKADLGDLKPGDWKRVQLSILFADIRGFTTLSESMTPEENFRFINSYLSRMGPVIRQHGGFIDKFIGDGIMALFPRRAEDALRAAIAMQKSIQIYNRHRARCGYVPIRIGIGIHFGDTIIGTVGENQRLDITVISDAVNVASRLESLSKRYGAAILTSGGFLSQVPRRKTYDVRHVDRVRLKGKNQAVDIYEILNALPKDEHSIKLRNRIAVEKALKLLLAGQAEDATKTLVSCAGRLPEDTSVQVLLGKAEVMARAPMQDRTQTVEILHE